MKPTVDVIVIGAGQAGLATSYWLTQAGVQHIVLETGFAGESWRSHRWKSFRMVSPNFLNRLPGYPYSGDDHDGFLTSREMVDYLDGYARSFGAPVHDSTPVLSIKQEGDHFVVWTDVGEIHTRAVVVATGAHQRPFIPPIASSIPTRVSQIHADRYWEPDHLPKGDVLVVGGGQSGTQIALELRSAGRAVYLSAGRCAWYPRRLYGRDILWWRDQMGEFETLVDTLPDPAAARLACTPLIRWGEKDLSLRTMADEGVTLLGRFSGAKGEVASFAPDLHSSIAYGDEAARGFVARIHAFALSRGDIHQPSPEPLAGAWKGGELPSVTTELDLRRISTIVWATGYRPDLGWIDLPVRDAHGYPIQRRGASEHPGLWFMGLHLMSRRGSGFVLGVGLDAAEVTEGIRRHLSVLTGRTQGAPGDSDRCPRRG